MDTTEFLDLTQVTIQVIDATTPTALVWEGIWRTGSISADETSPPFLNELVFSESNGGHTGISQGGRVRPTVTFETQADQFFGTVSVGTLHDMLCRTSGSEFETATYVDANTLVPNYNLLIKWDRAANSDIKSMAYEGCTFNIGGAMDDKMLESIVATCHGRVFRDGKLYARDRRETDTAVPTWANPS